MAGEITPESALALVARHDGLEHVVPAVSAVHVAGTQSTAFEVAKLVEHEQRVIADAGGQQPSIGCHHRAAKLEHHAAAEIEPNSIRFTPWVRYGRLARSSVR